MSNEIYVYLDQIFEWDQEKARKNWRRHRVLFTEAATAFFDRNAVVFSDEEHSLEEQRYTVLGEILRSNESFLWFMSNGAKE